LCNAFCHVQHNLVFLRYLLGLSSLFSCPMPSGFPSLNNGIRSGISILLYDDWFLLATAVTQLAWSAIKYSQPDDRTINMSCFISPDPLQAAFLSSSPSKSFVDGQRPTL